MIAFLVAFLLFALGPQSGSLDADEDGFPEIPVVVASTSSIAEASKRVLESGRSTIPRAFPEAEFTAGSLRPESTRLLSTARTHYSGFRFLCLRC